MLDFQVYVMTFMGHKAFKIFILKLSSILNMKKTHQNCTVTYWSNATSLFHVCYNETVNKT